MKVTLDQLKKLLATYRMKVLRVNPIEDGFIIDTNKGKKVVTVWENAELLKWSNGWREALFEQGHESVERFLTNQNRKKYIRYQGKYFVLTQATEGKTPDPANRVECVIVGEMFAKLHSALDRMDQGMVLTSSSEIDEDFFSKGSTAIKQVMQNIEQKEQPALIDEIIYANLPLIYRRFRRAYQLWEGMKDSLAYFPLSFQTFQLDQIKQTQNGWLISGGYNREIAPLHQDTVHMIRQIYEKSGWSLEAVTAFLEGYEKQRKPTDNELVYILAQLAVPREVWQLFAQYLATQQLKDDEVEQLVEAIERQHYWDELTIHFGRFIDRKNEATA